MAESPTAAARRLRISEITVIGTHCVGVGADGALYRFAGNRWIRLEPVTTATRHARRIVRYAGHHEVPHA